MMSALRAGVAKLVYAPDSKSGVRQGHVGSSPTSGTISLRFSPIASVIQPIQGCLLSRPLLKLDPS